MPPGGGFPAVRFFPPPITPGDKWGLTADGNTLEVFKNGVSQFTYTTDGSYATGDVGIEAYTPNFAFMGWEGGDTAAVTPMPTITSFTPTSGLVRSSVTISGTNFTGATAVTFNGVSASFTVTSATTIQATVPTGATTGPLRVTTPAGTATSASAFTVVSPPTLSALSLNPSSVTGGSSSTRTVTLSAPAPSGGGGGGRSGAHPRGGRGGGRGGGGGGGGGRGFGVHQQNRRS